MKIGIFSDVHLEFHTPVNQTKITDRIIETARGVDVLFNAGDTHPNKLIRDYFIQQIQEALPEVNYIDVLGNHDLYGSEFMANADKMYEIDGFKIYVSTLWTDFRGDLDSKIAAQKYISDFRQIKNVTAGKMTEQFQLASHMIEMERPDIILTHFCPHPNSVHPRWGNQPLNYYFCPDLSLLIEKIEPKLMVHGHTHDPFDYRVGKTRIVCNPMAYPKERFKKIEDYSVQVVEVE